MSKSPTTTKGGKELPPIHPGKILFEDMQDEEINRFDLDSLDRAVIERDVIPKQAA
jgi:hypothetical protein